MMTLRTHPDRPTTNGRPRLTSADWRMPRACGDPFLAPDCRDHEPCRRRLPAGSSRRTTLKSNTSTKKPSGRAASRAPPTRSARAGRMSARCPSSPCYGGAVIASVRMTRIAAGEGRALLLGPLAVRPAYKNLGIGRELVRIARRGRRARPVPRPCCWSATSPITARSASRRFPRGQISMPRPVDLDRLLAVELEARRRRGAEGHGRPRGSGDGGGVAPQASPRLTEALMPVRESGWNRGASYRPSRYHIEPSASSSRPRPKKPPNSGTRDTDFRTLSLVVLQADPVAAGGVAGAAHRHDAAAALTPVERRPAGARCRRSPRRPAAARPRSKRCRRIPAR